MSLISVVIPSYNEQENIERTASVLAEILGRTEMEYELIFVDDGSKDETYARICAEADKNPRIKGVRFSRNFGKEASIFAGLRSSTGDCCVVIDCDLQHPPEIIPQMIALWRDGYEIVEGVKSSRGKEGLAYKLSAGLFYKLISKAAKIDMASSSDFKLLDRKVVDALAALPEKSTFFRALSFWMGFRSVRLEFTVAERTAGKSKWSFSQFVALRHRQYHFLYGPSLADCHHTGNRHAGDLCGAGDSDSLPLFDGPFHRRIYHRDPAAAHHRRMHHAEPGHHRPLYCENLR